MPPETTPPTSSDHTPEARPSVVVSHLDIIYEVYGAKRGRPAAAAEQEDGLRVVERVLGRQPDKLGHVQKVHAVKDVSFVATVGESIGIIGRNGSGKSTLLRAIAGLIPPSGGSVWLSGEPSLLGVNAVLLGDLTGERNIMIGGQALGLSPKEVRARFDDIVEFSGIGDFVYMPMKAYSSGMGARLRFAISTARTPDILMVDEALSTGDADFKARSSDRIAEIREEAGTVFLVSHSNNTVKEMCTRVLWMDKGRLIADGPADDVVAEYQKTFPDRSAIRAARRAAQRAKAEQEQAQAARAEQASAEQPSAEHASAEQPSAEQASAEQASQDTTGQEAAPNAGRQADQISANPPR